MIPLSIKKNRILPERIKSWFWTLPLFSTLHTEAVIAVPTKSNHRKPSKALRIRHAMARKLLDEVRYPIGRSQRLYKHLKPILDDFKKFRANDEESVMLSLQLIERVVTERTLDNDKKERFLWIYEPRYFTQLYIQWRQAALEGRNVMAPEDLLQKLRDLIENNPRFGYDMRTITVIMDVLLKKQEPEKAPHVAQDLFDQIRAEYLWIKKRDNAEFRPIMHKKKKSKKMKKKLKQRKDPSLLRPDKFIYSQLLHAWANSNLPEAEQKMMEIMERMRLDQIQITQVMYNIYLKLYAKGGTMDAETTVNKIDAILESMKEDGLQPSIVNLSRAIQGYIQARALPKAEAAIQQMPQSVDATRLEHNILRYESIKLFVSACATSIHDTSSDDLEMKTKLLESVRRVAETMNIPVEDCSTTTTTTTIENETDVERQSKRLVQLCFSECARGTLQALSNDDKTERAEVFFKTTLDDENVTPSVSLLNTAMSCWTQSKHPDSFDKANELLRFTESHPKLQEQNIRGDKTTFDNLLHILFNATIPEAGEKADAILREMDRRHQEGNDIQPDQYSWSVALKICIKENDRERFEELLSRMWKSEVHPSLDTYNEILRSWSMHGNVSAAEYVETILGQMQELASSKSPALVPNAASYCIVMNAWARANAENTADQMWKLYEDMMQRNIEPDLDGYTSLISVLSMSEDLQVVERAESLLRAMEENRIEGRNPDYNHFVPVVKAWVRHGELERATDLLLHSAELPYHSSESENSSKLPGAAYQVVSEWAKRDLCKATFIVEKLEEIKELKGQETRPNTHLYLFLRSEWLASDHPDKVYHMENVNRRLQAIEAKRREKNEDGKPASSTTATGEDYAHSSDEHEVDNTGSHMKQGL